MLGLYANLCRDRNNNNLKKIESVGISLQHIRSVLNSKSINFHLKSHYFTLYEVLFLDKNPTLPLEKSEKRNYLWQNLDDEAAQEESIPNNN